MFQKLIIMIILNLDIENIIQRQIIIVICFFYLIGTIQQNPYKQKSLQNLEVLLQVVIVLSLVLQTIIYALEYDIYSILVIIVILFFINLYCLVRIIFQYYHSAINLIIKSQSENIKKFLHLLYKIKVIKFDINKKQSSLSRISNLWKMIYKNKSKINFRYIFPIQQLNLQTQKLQNTQLETQFEMNTVTYNFNNFSQFQQDQDKLLSRAITIK
ncbi:transmembrane protein, putative (macronuclear) [Tetrahymena thermophila SB210]|uniref:Transmembrane protein, putative n=1 Tax=Tetrahymena thermophila (strain SB210) TaxID=312017 RepID=W7XD71_TETTS|nr:transmembrane protein, putative [Tetrahymena thermophila SB210]EWS75447.1 transmembrane protein, putative [Tetrahymena thermophila SB210]|eukprot:XP_012652032.1 transmembrane protein, putative [Tetrahymena thermophila SB210]